MLRVFASAWAIISVLSVPALAQDVLIAPGFPELRIAVNGEELVIARVGGGGDALCPPNCPQPIAAAEGVQTVGAVEVIGFMRDELAAGTGLLLDVRMPDTFAEGHLPGAVSVPGVTLRPENPALKAILLAVGAQEAGDGLDFGTSRNLVIYGSGPGYADAAEGVRGLLAAGVPAEKLRYFRGGVQEWLQFGLTVSGSQSGE